MAMRSVSQPRVLAIFPIAQHVKDLADAASTVSSHSMLRNPGSARSAWLPRDVVRYLVCRAARLVLAIKVPYSNRVHAMRSASRRTPSWLQLRSQLLYVVVLERSTARITADPKCVAWKH
jgi:hypothetical protein